MLVLVPVPVPVSLFLSFSLLRSTHFVSPLLSSPLSTSPLLSSSWGGQQRLGVPSAHHHRSLRVAALGFLSGVVVAAAQCDGQAIHIRKLLHVEVGLEAAERGAQATTQSQDPHERSRACSAC